MVHKNIKATKKLAVALLAALLVMVVAAGCTSVAQEAELNPFVEMMEEIDISIGRSVSILKSGEPQIEIYRIPSTKYETLLSILRGIKSEQCIPVSNQWSGFDYEMNFRQVGGEWNFQCFSEEENVVYVLFLEENWFGYYKEKAAYPFFPGMGKNWLKVQSAPLYHFIVDGMNAYLSGDVVDKDVPAEVIEKAEEIMKRELDKIYAREKDDKGHWEFCSKLLGLSQLNTGTAGLDFSVNVYQLDYSTEWSHSTGSASAEGIRYLVYLYPDTVHGSRPVFLAELNVFDLIEQYGTPEMLAEYGDMYIAAAMELYTEWKETDA